MSGGGEKTEKPTSKRISDARKRGQVAKSADLNSALVLGGVILMITLYGGYLFQSMGRITLGFLRNMLRNTAPITLESFHHLFTDIVVQIVILLSPLLLGIMVIGVLSNLAQIKILFTTQTLTPSLTKLNPIQGFQRLFSQKSVIELLKGVAKMAVVGVVSYSVIKGEIGHLMATIDMGFMTGWQVIFNTAMKVCWNIFLVMLVIGVADWWYQHHHLMKTLKMTKQEIKDEYKNQEGNPQVKGKIKSAGQQIVRQKMLKSVPTADVVVTNPTHYAIAIQYDPDISPAPRVVAKGVDHFALKIREVAKENGVTIVENKTLARSLYAMVEVDHMVPPELFVAVAEVLAYVFKRNRGRAKPHIRRMFEGASS